MRQENYTPAVQQWMEQVMKCRGSDAEQVLHYCNKIQEHGEKVKDYNLLGFAQYYRGETYYLLNYVDGMFRNLISAVDNLKKAGVHELEASTYNLLGIVSVNQGNAHFALDYYLNGRHICDQYKLIEEKALIEYNIGSLYFKYHGYHQARSYFISSRQLLLKNKNVTNVFFVDISIASCYLEEGNLKKAQECADTAMKDYTATVDVATQLYLWCFQARLCHRQQNLEGREYYIKKISGIINEKMPIMEVFEDLYIYCRMLLEAECYTELQKMIQIMEQITEQLDILHLREKILSLKIELYKKNGEQEAYLKTAASYYELEQMAERENRYVINSVMGIRFSLEEVQKYSHKIEQENKQLQEKSERDPLTGLSNRFRLNEYAEKAFQNAWLEQYVLGVEILDIDYFKGYNDNYGHQKGDCCLIKISEKLKSFSARENVFCARYGGDEFILIYEGTTREEVQKLAEQLKKEIAEMKIEHKFSEVDNIVTISQGICIGIPEDGRKVWDYLHQADKMLYEIKQGNRNGIALWENDKGKIQAQETETIIK